MSRLSPFALLPSIPFLLHHLLRPVLPLPPLPPPPSPVPPTPSPLPSSPLSSSPSHAPHPLLSPLLRFHLLLPLPPFLVRSMCRSTRWMQTSYIRPFLINPPTWPPICKELSSWAYNNKQGKPQRTVRTSNIAARRAFSFNLSSVYPSEDGIQSPPLS